MNKVQKRIKDIVDDYKILFADEYKLFVKQQIEVRKGNIGQYAEIKGDNMIERKLFDTPENLHAMFIETLNTEELTWFKSKDGGRWFAKYFKEFRASEKL